MKIKEAVKDYLLMQFKKFAIAFVSLIIWLGLLSLIFILDYFKIGNDYYFLIWLVSLPFVYVLVGKLIFKTKYLEPRYSVELEFWSKYGLGKIFNLLISIIIIGGGIYALLYYQTHFFFIIFGIGLILAGIYALIKSLK